MSRNKSFSQSKVLRKAMLLFWKNGYHATSIQDIVDYLGINRASIYDTYGNKWGLFLKALNLYIFEYTENLNQSLDTELEAKDSLKKFFEKTINDSLKDKDRKGCFIVNACTELIPGEKEFEKMLDETRMIVQTHFQEFIKRAQEHGKISKDKDPEAIAFVLYSYYNGLKVLLKTKPNKTKATNSIASVLEILD